MVTLIEQIPLPTFISELSKYDRLFTFNLLYQNRTLYGDKQTAGWICLISKHIPLRDIIHYFATHQTEQTIFSSTIRYLDPEIIEEWLFHSTNQGDLVNIMSDHRLDVAIRLFLKSNMPIQSRTVIGWVDSLVRNTEPTSMGRLHTISDEVTPLSWTVDQRKIFSFIDTLSTSHFPAARRLSCLNHVFDYLQITKNQLYAQRNPHIDAIGQFFGRGELITHHRAIQLNYLRTISFTLLKEAASQAATDEDAQSLLQLYEQMPLFSVHRHRGFFNAYLSTKHQTLINEALMALKR